MLLREEEERELRRRSSVLRRGLPRPPSVSNSIPNLSKSAVLAGEQLSSSSGLVSQEMIQLLLHDEVKFPSMSNGAKKDKSGNVSKRPIAAVDLESFTDDELQIAREAIDMERRGLDRGMSIDDFTQAWEEAYKAEMFLPTRGENGAFGVPVNKAEVFHISRKN
jgi:pre-mRNA-splicing factor CDC5/CEF1